MKKLILISICMAIFMKCRPDLKIDPNVGTILNHNYSSAKILKNDQDLEDFARNLAKTLNNKKICELIKDEAKKKIDGDFNILIGKKYYENDSFSTIFFAEIDQNFQIENLKNTKKSKSILERNPLLNISVPINIEKWNTENFKPIVLYLGYNFSEKDKFVTGFNSDGKKFLFDITKEPNYPVIVVSESERAEISKQGNLVIKYNSKESSKGSKNGRTNGFANNSYIYSKAFQTSNISKFESWVQGAPEIVIKVYAPLSAINFSGTGLVREINYLEPSSRNSICAPNWWSHNVSILFWDSATFTKSLLFQYYEWDGGSTTEETVSNSYKLANDQTVTLSTKTSMGSNDDKIGTFIVNQDAPPPFSDYYDPDSEFFVKILN